MSRGSGSLVDTFSDSFFTWFKETVLPYLLASICILLVIASIILNSFVLHVLRKRKIASDPKNRFLIQLIIVDFLACTLVLIPAIVTAIAKEWLLSTPVCYIHAILMNWFFLVTFGLVTAAIAQQTFIQVKPVIGESVFNSNCKVSVISLFIWILHLVIAVSPTFGFVTVDYDFYHASCIVFLDESIIYLSSVFAVGILIPTVFTIVFFSMIFNLRRRKVNEKKHQTKLEKIKLRQSTTGGEMLRNSSTASIATNITCASESEEIRAMPNKTNTSVENDDVFTTKEDERNRELYQKKTNRYGGQRQSKAARMFKRAVSIAQNYDIFSDDSSDVEHHLSVTYLIMWSFLIASWLPYFILNFYDAFHDGLWRGYYTLMIVFAILSYISKPIIYLAHNRHFRKTSKEILPQNVVRKVSSVRMSISNVVDKLDKLVFKTPNTTEKTVGVAMATNKAKNAFLNKLKKSKESAVLVINEENEQETELGSDNAVCTNGEAVSRLPMNRPLTAHGSGTDDTTGVLQEKSTSDDNDIGDDTVENIDLN
ncbi:hypothetical protein FSP39_010208 [Pinctada imbricata]|uniref:G-protein coupled receptors family 1 profile domain-containing protein n=1 Tax=Pinctada imbricata TaxID=66713 RepID=A0AA88XR14_PINIB|nr:hypothetical protein FSP39_010208 [Pinctada imbricata]